MNNKFYILGDIGEWGVWPSEVQSFLNANDKQPVDILINSPGGDLDAGITIYNLLKKHNGPVNTYVVGLAASAASLAFMGGTRRVVETGASLMIHKISAGIMGTSDELRKLADVADKLEASLADIYVAETKQPREQIVNWINEETYFTAAEAVEYGFATETAQNVDPIASQVYHNLAGFQNLPTFMNRAKKFNETFKNEGPAPEKPAAPAPTEQTTNTNKDPAMDKKISEVTEQELASENSKLYNKLKDEGVQAERARIKNLRGLMAYVDEAPDHVKNAVRARIDELVEVETATAENSLPDVLKAMAKAQSEFVEDKGKGPRNLSKKFENKQIAPSTNTEDEEDEELRKVTVSNLGKGFKNHR